MITILRQDNATPTKSQLKRNNFQSVYHYIHSDNNASDRGYTVIVYVCVLYFTLMAFENGRRILSGIPTIKNILTYVRLQKSPFEGTVGKFWYFVCNEF